MVIYQAFAMDAIVETVVNSMDTSPIGSIHISVPLAGSIASVYILFMSFFE